MVKFEVVEAFGDYDPGEIVTDEELRAVYSSGEFKGLLYGEFIRPWLEEEQAEEILGEE